MQIITKKVRLVWDNPYVTDGLVAMWDGQWNFGGGIHSPKGNRLYELISSATETAVASTFTVGKNFWEVETAIAANRVTELTTAFKNAILGGAAHLDVITYVNAPATAIYGNVITMSGINFGYQPASGLGGFSLLTSGRHLVQDTKLIGRSAANLEIDIDTTQRTLTYTVGTESTTISVESLDSLSNHFYIAVPGTRLYCVRVYNRLLSPSEKSANHEMDKLRFPL